LKVLANRLVREITSRKATDNVPLEGSSVDGAMGLFRGEIGELSGCGIRRFSGAMRRDHVKSTASIGLIKIVSEAA